MPTVAGVISDTHGLIRAEALEALAGVSLIIHAGDVGDPTVLEALREIAPVHAIRGNVDTGLWARELAETLEVRIEEANIFVIHDRAALMPDPRSRGFHGVIFGHSHRPSVSTDGGVLYLNPGSAGPRRFRLPITVARLTVSGSQVRAEILPVGATIPEYAETRSPTRSRRRPGRR